MATRRAAPSRFHIRPRPQDGARRLVRRGFDQDAAHVGVVMTLDMVSHSFHNYDKPSPIQSTTLNSLPELEVAVGPPQRKLRETQRRPYLSSASASCDCRVCLLVAANQREVTDINHLSYVQDPRDMIVLPDGGIFKVLQPTFYMTQSRNLCPHGSLSMLRG